MPEKGFYYHYKHDPSGSFNNYSYEVIGVAMHTEDRTFSVLYRPLYENTYLTVDYSARPLAMFMESIEQDGQTIPRFTRITDETLISELSAISDRMYGAKT